MSIIDKTVEANRQFAKGYDRSLGARPAPKIAVVTCMDPRLSDLSGILGLPQSGYRRDPYGRTRGYRRCARRACGLDARPREQGDTAAEPYRLRVRHVHR